MAFDADGLFIGRVHPSLLIGYDNGVGTFQAEIPDHTGIIHVIANYDQWDSFDERAALQKDERELIPSFTSTKMVFWAGKSSPLPLIRPGLFFTAIRLK